MNELMGALSFAHAVVMDDEAWDAAFSAIVRKADGAVPDGDELRLYVHNAIDSAAQLAQSIQLVQVPAQAAPAELPAPSEPSEPAPNTGMYL